MRISTIFSSSLTLLILFNYFDEILTSDSMCGTWPPFRDEKCFGILDATSRTFAEAEKFCTSAGATLVTIHSKEEQECLNNYLFGKDKVLGNFWIGARMMESNKIGWTDNSQISYTNWDPKGPRNKPNYCVQTEYDESVVGKWIDEPCETKNLVVCQKMPIWSMEKLQKTLMDTRKELKDALDEAYKKNVDLKKTQEEEKIASDKKFADQKHEIDNLKLNLIPIGFLYTQLPNEKPPTSIWPSMTWSDVSSSYAGVFFRVEGGGSEPFGQTQAENDRRVLRVERTLDDGANVYSNITINTDAVGQNTKTSGWMYSGDYTKQRDNFCHLRLVATTGEIRPRNMAIRVWKRTG